jgi:hypothetical protein
MYLPLRSYHSQRIQCPCRIGVVQVRINQKATTGTEYGALTKLALFSSTGKLLGLFGNPASTDKESIVKASETGQSLTGFCTKLVAGAGMPARMADVTETAYADWTPPLQSAPKRIARVTGYYATKDASKKASMAVGDTSLIVGVMFTYSDNTTELMGFAAPNSESRRVPAGQLLVRVESNQVRTCHDGCVVHGVNSDMSRVPD